MLNFLNSKKAIEMCTTQGILLLGLVAVLIVAKGDPSKVEALLQATEPIFYAIAGVGGATVIAQGVADHKK